MKKLLLLIMACLAIMIGCSDDSALQDDMNYTIETDPEMVEKYMEPLMNYGTKEALTEYQNSIETERRAYYTTLFRINQSGTMAILPPFDYGCSDSEVFVDVNGVGYASSLGKHTVNFSFCSFDGLNSYDTIYGLLTFKNGDMINSKLIYASSPDENGNWQQFWGIYDGTGQFDEAIGIIGLQISADFTNYVWTNNGYGLLIYKKICRTDS